MGEQEGGVSLGTCSINPFGPLSQKRSCDRTFSASSLADFERYGASATRIPDRRLGSHFGFDF